MKGMIGDRTTLHGSNSGFSLPVVVGVPMLPLCYIACSEPRVQWVGVVVRVGINPCNPNLHTLIIWVAVKKLKLSCHNGYM